MLKPFLACLGCSLLAAGSALADGPAGAAPAEPKSPAAAAVGAVKDAPGVASTLPQPPTGGSGPVPGTALTLPADHDCPAPCGPRIWASTDYLLWWVKSSPLPVPLVTTNAAGTLGALNEPGTQVLFGDGSPNGLHYGTFSGIRATVGGWIDNQHVVGIEGSGFLLERRAVLFDASSAGGNSPVLSVPLNVTVPFNGNPAGETALNSGGGPNQITDSSSLRLWGAESDILLSVGSGSRYHLSLLTGFRYLDLAEKLSLNDNFPDTTLGGGVTVTDLFATRNQFYGGQLGARGGLTSGRWSADATVKVALGSMHEVESVAGSTTVTGGAFGNTNGTFAGGLLGEPSNSGRTASNSFCVIPEVQLQVGANLGQHVRGYVGYDFLYVSDVLRPGNQIDRNINITQNAFFGGTGGTLLGAAAPLPLSRTSDFWAHGLYFGVEIHY